MDPFCNGYPDLPKLSTIEEILISKVFVVMQMYRISGTGAVGYKGHCLNVQNDIEQVSAWCRVLPWLPNELPIYVIRMVRTDNVSLKLFKVNLESVRKWLMFLKQHHPEYRNVQIDYDRFTAMSRLRDDDGDVNVSTGLTQVSEEEETTTVTDNNDTSNNSTSNDDNSVLIEPEIENGPEQGGATSFVVDEDSGEVIQETHIFLPADRLNTESDQQLITSILRDEYGTNQNPFTVNVDNTNTLNDYNTPSLQSMAFPTLFPYGVGDITMRTRRYDVTFTNAMKHYLNYAVHEPRLNTHIFPFAEHKRWVHWAQNTEERHRFNSQRTVFLRKNEGIANLTEEQLRRIVNEGGDEFNALIRKMHVYNANIIGSSSYFYKKRKELEALMETCGMPTGWFTLSAADNHWSDLHNLLYSSRCLPRDIGYNSMTEKQKTRFRISMVLRYPHVVDEYFQTRVKLFIDSFLVHKQSLSCKYFWYRVEYQQRGTAHVHGCFRLNSDPGVSKLCDKVRDGRIAVRKLQLAGIRVRCRQILEDGRMDNDEFVKRADLDKYKVEYRTNYTAEEIEALQRTIEESIVIEEKVCAYNDFIFTTYNEDPPSDALKEERDVSTKFNHTDTNVHPSTLCHGSCNSLSPYQLNTHYCKLVNAVQRHVCSPYCWVNEEKDCRFSYPLRVKHRSHIVIQEHIVSKKQKRNNEEVDVSVLRYTIDMKSRRNDLWVNTHNKTALQSWMANVDMRLVCDIGKVVDYLTKYITKTEKTLTRAAEGVITAIMTRTFDEGNDVITTLRRIMGKLLGCRMMSQQESCHLINSFALVSSSHNFILVNVMPTANVIGDMNDEPAEETALEHVPDDIATVYSLLEMYGIRNNADKYYHTTAHTLQSREFNVHEMTFHTFCQHFYVGQRSNRKNKLCLHRKSNFVPVFYPNKSFDPNSEDFYVYCKIFLIKFRPFFGNITNAWNNLTEPTEIVNMFEQYVEFVNANGIDLPDHVRRELDFYDNELGSPGSQNLPTGPINLSGPSQGSTNAVDSDDANIQLELNNLLVPNAEDGENPLDDDNVRVIWNNSHNWYETVNYFELPSTDYILMLKNYIVEARSSTEFLLPGAVTRNDLSGSQIVAHDIYIHNVTSESYTGGLMVLYGMGGTGKSYVINSIRHTLKTQHNQDLGVTSTTGLTANAIKGTTIHSELNLPIGRRRYNALRGQSLMNLQSKYRNVNGLIVDEFSMLRAKELYHIDLRLQQIKCNNRPFGGLCVLLAGDPGQLPPVAGQAVWDLRNNTSNENRNGCLLFRNVTDVVHLDKNLRLDPSDENAVLFDGFLRRLRDGEVTNTDYEYVIKNCCRHWMGNDEYEERGFNDPDVTKVHCTNHMCNQENLQKLVSLNRPILKVCARNTGEAINANSSDLLGLYNLLYICVGAKVMLTTNVCQHLGMSNGVIGHVVDIIFDRDDPVNVPGTLPAIVWVEFNEGQYLGPSFFPNDVSRKNWVPIEPITANMTAYKNNQRVPSSRTMLPLKLSYSFTPWKIQGQTISSKVVGNLGTQERSDGLTYVIFSRVRKFSDVAIDGGMTWQRITKKIRDRVSFQKRKEMERVLLKQKIEDTLLKYQELFGDVPTYEE